MRPGRTQPSSGSAFTLIEVMLAMLLFFLAMFSILELVSICLHNARLLQKPTVNLTSVADFLSQTNHLEDGDLAGDFRDILGEGYENFEWQAEVREITNGLYHVEFGVVERAGKGGSVETMSILLYDPNSSSTGRGAFRRTRP